ncbi:DUF4253 domain-containing protein [Streptomyces sp. NPDC002734]|uniref:DUF4253 domain-containing protein n=1 Tax=Streptomyces sp. NPDC002734 TaxID=3154426 RepID=UPI00331FD069
MASLPNALVNPPASLRLPPGRLVDTTVDGPWHEPLLWYGDVPLAVGDWAVLRATGRGLGLLPVLLDVGHDGTPDEWSLAPARMSYPGDHDAAAVLEAHWDRYLESPAFTDYEEEDENEDEVVPGDAWQGLAPATTPGADPDAEAAETADFVADGVPWLHDPRPALVPARRSADIPAAIGWSGPTNHENDVARLCAVLRSWEDRFGTRVLALTADRLALTVAAPPTTPEHAEAVAAEHYAFCPDNIYQGASSLAEYAEQAVRDSPVWIFWWD